ncbi:MAG TPA: CbiX/SirB N-terminal domain-containing protein [Burkholderiales bacterium]|jgi:sirohydrochlorin cobaltochelatase|nr:CbiX/SirB N-terminal domain-containing protein [Burkholderiales bacterium]
MQTNPESAIVLFAHGARDEHWAAPFRKIQSMVRDKKPGVSVELAFLELMRPTLDQAVASLVARSIKNISVIPLFMAQGGHLKQDLPRKLAEVRQHYPTVTFRVSAPVGEAQTILAAITDWICSQHGC